MDATPAGKWRAKVGAPTVSPMVRGWRSLSRTTSASVVETRLETLLCYDDAILLKETVDMCKNLAPDFVASDQERCYSHAPSIIQSHLSGSAAIFTEVHASAEKLRFVYFSSHPAGRRQGWMNAGTGIGLQRVQISRRECASACHRDWRASANATSCARTSPGPRQFRASGDFA